MFYQAKISLPKYKRGFHLITEMVIEHLPEIQKVNTGLVNLFLQHTSASLTLNENADYTVRLDMEAHFNRFVPQNQAYYQHDYEGHDDMPAHIKSSSLGCQLTIPITNGKLALGTWQGIYLGEHRDLAGSRSIIATIHGV